MRSMTGFGLGEAPLGEGRLVLEVRSLNHRFLDVRVRLPTELSEQSFYLEQLARERLARGRYDIGVRVEGSALPPPDFRPGSSARGLPGACPAQGRACARQRAAARRDNFAAGPDVEQLVGPPRLGARRARPGPRARPVEPGRNARHGGRGAAPRSRKPARVRAPATGGHRGAWQRSQRGIPTAAQSSVSSGCWATWAFRSIAAAWRPSLR